MSDIRIEQTQENLAAAIAVMDTWEDVSVELYTRGVTGHMADACHCPVATYLSAQIDEEVFVTPDGAQAFPAVGYTENVPLPTKVNQFVYAFDSNKHPELVGTDRPHNWD